MTPQLWIGFGFLSFLIIVLVYTLLWDDSKKTDRQYVILKFLTALSAGFAGGFLSGKALFKITGNMGSGGEMAVIIF